MDELPKKCVPCNARTRALTSAEAEARVATLAGWTLDYPRLRRSDATRNFLAALAWVNRVGQLAEEQGHHPDFHITDWNRVELVLWTHAIGGLSINDFVMAKAINACASESD